MKTGLVNIRIVGKPNRKLARRAVELGDDGTGSKVTWQANCVTISCWVYFKIGGAGNLGSWILTGQWAPFAWIQLDYKICCDGSVTVNFYGTDMRSQYYYIDWEPRWTSRHPG